MMLLLRENGFKDLWKEACKKFDLKEPCLFHVRKAPKQIDEGSSPHFFALQMDLHKKKYSMKFSIMSRGVLV